MSPNRRQLLKIVLSSLGGAVVGIPTLSFLIHNSRKLEPPHAFADSSSTLISRIDKIFEGDRLSDENHPKRDLYLYSLTESLLVLNDERILSEAKSRLNELATSYTCIGSKMDSLFLDELLSALLDGRNDFYERFIEEVKHGELIGKQSPESLIEKIQSGNYDYGEGFILDGGFKDVDELLKFTRVKELKWAGDEIYIFALASRAENIGKEYRSFIQTAGVSKDGSEVNVHAIMYELGISQKYKRRNPFVSFDSYDQGSPNVIPATDWLTKVKSQRRDHDINRSLGIIEGESASPTDGQLIIVSFPRSHASSVPHIVPKNFYWHTHPIARLGELPDPRGVPESGGDMSDYLHNTYWKKELPLLLKISNCQDK